MSEDQTRYARLAARLLNQQRSESPQAPPQAPADVRRDAVVAAMALAIAAKARRRRLVALSAATLALAAGVVVVVKLTGGSGLWGAKPGAGSALIVEHASGSGNQLVRAGSVQALPDLGVLAVGDSVRSGDGGTATLGYANGTRITLSPSARLRIDGLGATRRFSLSSGQLQAHVAKLGQGERFVVSTPDSEVEVRGTVFAVAVDSSPSRCRDSASQSIVSVSEGAVWVRSGDKQVVVQPGESWVTPCLDSRETAEEATAAAGSPVVMPDRVEPTGRTVLHKPAPAKVTSAAVPVTGQRELAPGSESARTPAPTSAVSRLAEQNDLFSAAMAAERQGQHDLALRKLDELVARYPGGPLSESARAQRQRILSAK
jgi:ferric-dicitrate binding protein FerR (iron transport regulator)